LSREGAEGRTPAIEHATRVCRRPLPKRAAQWVSRTRQSVPDDVVSLVAEEQHTVLRTVETLWRLAIEPQATWIREGHLDELRSRIRWTTSIDL
jgi:hypothetical protein